MLIRLFFAFAVGASMRCQFCKSETVLGMAQQTARCESRVQFVALVGTEPFRVVREVRGKILLPSVSSVVEFGTDRDLDYFLRLYYNAFVRVILVYQLELYVRGRRK